MNVQDDYDNLVSGLTCDVTEEDYDLLHIKLQKLKDYARVEHRAIALYDIHRRRFLIKEDHHLEILGYGGMDLDEVGSYHTLIHPDDLPLVLDAEMQMHRYLKGKPAAEKKEYKLAYDYRVKAASGEYMRFIHQLSIFETDRSGSAWILLVISDVLERFPLSTKPRRMLIHLPTRKNVLFLGEHEWGEAIATKREKEILELIGQGMDSRQISEKLFISVHTVNNHRQNILRKSCTNNITQAIKYLQIIGIA